MHHCLLILNNIFFHKIRSQGNDTYCSFESNYSTVQYIMLQKTTPINSNNNDPLKYPLCAVMYLLLTRIVNLKCSRNKI